MRRPDDTLLAFLLGTAIGVMFLLSVAEMWLHNAMEHGWPGVTAAVMGGSLLYQIAQPFLPDFQPSDLALAAEADADAAAAQQRAALDTAAKTLASSGTSTAKGGLSRRADGQGGGREAEAARTTPEPK